MIDTAHRALDKTNNKMPKQYQYTSALTFIGHNVTYDHLHRQTFTLRNKDHTKWKTLTLESDHKKIMEECYSLIKKITEKLNTKA